MVYPRSSRPRRVLAAALLAQLLWSPGATAWGSGKKKAAQADPDPHDPNVLGREIRGMTEKTVPVRTHSIYARQSSSLPKLSP